MACFAETHAGKEGSGKSVTAQSSLPGKLAAPQGPSGAQAFAIPGAKAVSPVAKGVSPGGISTQAVSPVATGVLPDGAATQEGQKRRPQAQAIQEAAKRLKLDLPGQSSHHSGILLS